MDDVNHSYSSGQLTAGRLIEALNSDQFVLYCQPISRLRPVPPDARYIEILVRFLEEEQKLLPPGSFFPLLEEAELMPVLDRWVIRQVLRWLKLQRDQAPNRALPRCSVNLSAHALRDRQLAGFVKKELLASTVPPDKLSFEFSMVDIRANKQAFIDLASLLKPVNCSMAVTGFGIGATSLPGLHRLGVRIVKIDGGLIRNLPHKQSAMDRLRSIVDACLGLGMHSVAEMVEDQQTISVLCEAGVDYAQGFGVGIPIPLSQLG